VGGRPGYEASESITASQTLRLPKGSGWRDYILEWIILAMFISGCASSFSAVFWNKVSICLIGRPAYPFILFFFPAADKLSALLRLRLKLASAFNNSVVQLQLHKLVNYGTAS